MKLTCQRFLLLFLILQSVLAQEQGKEISSGFKKSINKFIEKIAVLKKNMKKLAAERAKLKSNKKETIRDESDELDSQEYEILNDNNNDEDFNSDIFRDEENFYDFDEEDDAEISVNLGIEDDDIDFETEDDIDLSQEVDDIEDSLKTESSFLDKLLVKLSKKEDEKRESKTKIKEFVERAKNRGFLTGLKEKSQRAKAEQQRLSGFLDRFRSSQSNLNRPRFRQDPLTRFKDILGVPPSGGFRPTRFREDPLELFEENRGVVDRVPRVQVNKAFRLLDGIPQAETKDGNVFVFTFADSHNPVLVFDG